MASGFPVKSSQGSEIIGGVKTDLHVSAYSDRVLVIITHSGKPGTVVHVSRERAVSGSTSFTVKVLLGKRDDIITLYARKIAEVIGQTCSKPLLISLCLPSDTPEAFRAVVAAIPKHKVW